MRLFTLVAGISIFAGLGSLRAQEVVSARAGLIHYIEGAVAVDGKAVDEVERTSLFSRPQEVKEGQVLATGLGRAEVLLSPGVVLRVGEESAFRMISNKLDDTRVELLRGAVVLTVDDLLKENKVTLRSGNGTLTPQKAGVYRITAGESPEVMVYDGKIEVVVNDERSVIKKGRAASLANAEMSRKFDTEEGDPLLRWAERRSGYLALANVSAAKSMLDAGNYSGLSPMWRWNPFFGMWTYIPARSMACNGFWGYCYYNPGRIYSVIYRPAPVFAGSDSGFDGPRYGYNRDYGYTTSSSRVYGGYSQSAPAASAAPSAPAASPRSAESSVGRGGAGGGGRSR
jgi:hypothetical protein